MLDDLEAALAGRAALDAVDALFDSRAVLLLNKVDRGEPAAVDRLCQELQDRRPLPLSVKTGQGLEALLARLVERAGQAFGGGENAAAITRLRHRRALEDCRDALRRGPSAQFHELKAEEIRRAQADPGRLP